MTTEYSYDSNGNLTTADDGTTALTYCYSYENRMISFSKSTAGASAPEERRWYYVARIYDNALSRPLFWGGLGVFTPVFLVAFGYYVRYKGGKESLRPVMFKVSSVGLVVMYFASMNAAVYAVETTSASYVYDADGRRISKTVDGTETKFFYDKQDAIADYDTNDTLLATYVTPSLDKNLSQTRSGSTYYYFADGLGSIRNLVDSSETVENVYDYYAFGGELGAWTESVTNRYTFTAREWDSESGIYYYRARMYSAARGTFLTRDSAFLILLSGIYRYAENNPVLHTDSSGKVADPLTVAIICAIIMLILAFLIDFWWNRQLDKLAKAARELGSSYNFKRIREYTMLQHSGDIGLANWVALDIVMPWRSDAEDYIDEKLEAMHFSDEQIREAKSNIKYEIIYEWYLRSIVNAGGDAKVRSTVYLRFSWTVTYPGGPKPYKHDFKIGQVDETVPCSVWRENDIANVAEALKMVRNEWKSREPQKPFFDND